MRVLCRRIYDCVGRSLENTKDTNLDKRVYSAMPIDKIRVWPVCHKVLATSIVFGKLT